MSWAHKKEYDSISHDLIEDSNNINIKDDNDYSNTASEEENENDEIDKKWADPKRINIASSDEEDEDELDPDIEKWQLQDLAEMTSLFFNEKDEKKKLLSRLNNKISIFERCCYYEDSDEWYR